MTSVGQDSPGAPTGRDVRDDLGYWVLGERALGATAVEGAVEALRVGDAGRSGEPLGAFEGQSGSPVGLTEKESVVGLAPPGPYAERRLHRVGEAECREHRSHPALLGLGLVSADQSLLLVPPQRLEPTVENAVVRSRELGPLG